ncbi:MAG: alpha/beta hydrolase [Firmicutes bacterium]|nr:alpha/beta hydrolase [Bacillota bacterium]
MIQEWDVKIPELSGDDKRKVYVFLPECYDFDGGEVRYPVMYMFDGHNVFYDSHATYGKSWGMEQYMERTGKHLIIVAVECSHRGNARLSEYSPSDIDNKTLGQVKGRGKIYMDWLINTLKVQIDRDFRTIPGRESTFICGSSMGGLMSLYAVTAYNHVFSRAACLSPSLWAIPEEITSIVESSTIRRGTRIYMDYGSREMSNHFMSHDALISMSGLLLKKNAFLTFRIVPDGTHNEASWERQIPIFMECLGVE